MVDLSAMSRAPGTSRITALQSAEHAQLHTCVSGSPGLSMWHGTLEPGAETPLIATTCLDLDGRSAHTVGTYTVRPSRTAVRVLQR